MGPDLDEALALLFSDAPQSGLAAVAALARSGSGSASRIASRLVAAVARTESEPQAGRVLVALAAAHLAARAPELARKAALDGAALLAPDDRAPALVATLRAAQAELALGDTAAARARLARSAAGLLALGDDDLADELATALRAAGEPLAADLVATARRGGRSSSEARLEVLGRIVDALGSSVAGTAEPLYEILRATIDATGADRGFLMVYDDATLRFELGLSRQGRALDAHDFAFSTTIVERALDAGRAVLVPDLSTVLAFATAASARDLGLRSAACVPLLLDRRRSGAAPAFKLPSVKGIAGVLYVDSKTEGSFAEKDARFLEQLADAALLALNGSAMAAALREATEPEPARPVSPRRKRRPARVPRSVEPVTLAHPYEDIVTRDPGLRAVLKLVDRVAATDASVLVAGESGTGKELVARALHRYGSCPQGPFVAIDCGGLSDGLMQHELFGHEKNAFTGAGDERPGLIERAHGGTVFFDEVAAMSPSLQAALLRVLQEGEVRRLGGTTTRPVRVRVVASTSRDLRALVEAGAFRHDLLFRLSVVNLVLPPLRDRVGDVPLLVEHLLARIATSEGKPIGIEPPALARLEEHEWPGNVRELENVLRAAALAASGTIQLAHVTAILGQAKPARPAAASPAAPRHEGTIEEIERRVIEERLEAYGWNQVQVAQSLGLDRTTLRRKLLRYGITRRR